jgi:hypothetical protein
MAGWRRAAPASYLRKTTGPGGANSHMTSDVYVWRRDVLAHAGFDATLSDRLAAHPRIDLHDLLNLVDRGCPPHLAARILAPLDDQPGPSDATSSSSES